jgi:hypothetical protein
MRDDCTFVYKPVTGSKVTVGCHQEVTLGFIQLGL